MKKLPLYNGGEIETVCFLQFVGMVEGIQDYLNVDWDYLLFLQGSSAVITYSYNSSWILTLTARGEYMS